MLRARVSDINDIDEGLRDHYKQEGEGWILDVEANEGFALENIQGLRNALQAERNETKKLKTNLSQFEGISPEDVSNFKQNSTKQQSSDEELNKLKSTYHKKLNDLQDELSKKDKVMNDYLLNSEINRVLSNASLVDNGAALLRPHIQSSLRVIDGQVTPVDKDGNPMISNKMNNVGNMSLDEFVEGMKSNKVYSGLFKADNIQGTGSKTVQNQQSNVNVDSNPFITKNLTEMSRLIKNSPQEAERLKAEAQAYLAQKSK